MSVTLSHILSDVNDKARNSTTGALDNNKRTRAINRVLEDLQTYADWEFTRRVKTFYFIEGISEYNLEDYVGCTCQDKDGATSIVDFKNPYDLRPLDGSGKSLEYQESRVVRENIRRNARLTQYGVDNGVLIVGFPRQISAALHGCDSLTGNGTWAVSGDASNLTLDEVIFSEGNGSLNFDGSGTSFVLTNSTFNGVDLSDFKNKSQLTMDVWLPTITNFTSIKVRVGSASGAYWEKTVTAPAGNKALQTGKNKFAFRWADSTETSTPDYTAVDYIQITITYGAATVATDFRVDDIRIGQEVEMELEYYSLAMVQDTAGDYQIGFNDDSVTQTDTLLGDTTAKRCVIQGSTYELFEIIGGKTERDRTDSYKLYELQKNELLKKAGHRIRRPSRILNFKR